MGIRKCIYTGKDADAKDNVIPKRCLGEDELHNWNNKAPVSKEYKDEKQDRMPTIEEMELNKAFHMLELARLDVAFYELRIVQLQERIVNNIKKTIKKPKKSRKDIEIEDAILSNKLINESEKAAELILEEKRKELGDIWK